MKFLMSVLIIRFLVELVTNKKDTATGNATGTSTGRVPHPAEFELR